tara:strand:- start:396 stop:1634 length:1239 start_codon:yes stop_codon:yes gene_type:complete
MKTGPNIVNDGLVFGYDTHTYSRFYNGVNTTNHLISLRTSFTNTVRTNGKAVAGEEEVYIPTIGKRNVKYVEYFNNYNNGDDLGCCPNLFNYHGGTTVPLVGNQSYTYSIVYKHTGGYTHPNFMYRYRYKEDGTYIGEGGLHSTARRTHLGDGWYHAWGSWTTNSDANYGRFYSFLYNYGTTVQRFYVAAISLVKNNSGSEHLIIPPNLLLEPNTSVTSTQSLIDLKGNTNIDVDDISFNSTGQPEFDGTDDYVSIDIAADYIAGGDFSVEAVIKGSSQDHKSIISANTSGGGNRFLWMVRSAGMGIHDGSSWYIGDEDVDDNNYHHIVLTYDFSTKNAKIYTDNILDTNVTTGNQINVSTSDSVSIGMEYDGTSKTDFFNGEIPIAKIYNKVLTDAEIKQNFDAYKNRFEL